MASLRVGRRPKKNRPERAVWETSGNLRRVGLQRQRLIFDRLMLMALQAVFVANDLPVKLVDHQVDCGVQVAIRALDKNILTFHMQINFNLLSLLFFLMVIDREDHTAIDYLIEVP